MIDRVEVPGCKCGCGLARSSGKILTVAELLFIQYPDMEFTSGSRCPVHNSSPAVGGSSTSGHLCIYGPNSDESCAIDGKLLREWNERRMRSVVVAAFRAGATGIGVMKEERAFHFDVKPRVYGVALWKRVNGSYIYFF